MKDCKYRLPCGRCEKRGTPCDAIKEKECEHEWELTGTSISSDYVINYYTCSKCGEKKSLSLGT